MQTHPGVGFVVGEEGDGAAAGVESVADADAGVVGEDGADAHGTDVKFHLALFQKADVAGQLAQADGEKAALHLHG